MATESAKDRMSSARKLRTITSWIRSRSWVEPALAA
jgi:hypothetical protein